MYLSDLMEDILGSVPLWYMVVFTVAVLFIYASAKAFCRGHPDIIPFDPREVGERAGVVSVQGQRAHMEDTYHASPRLDSKETWSFYGVFDGHGGARASAYVAKHLVMELIRQLNLLTNEPGRLPPIFPEQQGIPTTCYVLDGNLTRTTNQGERNSTMKQNGNSEDYLFNRIKHFFSHHLPSYTFTSSPHNAWENLIFTALSQAYKVADRAFLNLANANSWQDGTTAIACLIVPSPPVDKEVVYGQSSRRRASEQKPRMEKGRDTDETKEKDIEGDLADTYLYVANTGDSRGILVTANGGVVPMSEDHKPNRSDERRRIESSGGRVIHFGTWRVEGVLAVARAFGDRHLKRYVIPDPEIRCRKLLKSRDLFLILASDGVWDVLTNEDAAKLAVTVWQSNTYARSNLKTKLQAIAGRITTAAYQNGSMDNITTLVVHLPSHVCETSPPYLEPSEIRRNLDLDPSSPTSETLSGTTGDYSSSTKSSDLDSGEEDDVGATNLS